MDYYSGLWHIAKRHTERVNIYGASLPRERVNLPCLIHCFGDLASASAKTGAAFG
jgi:hypothetical protein